MSAHSEARRLRRERKQEISPEAAGELLAVVEEEAKQMCDELGIGYEMLNNPNHHCKCVTKNVTDK